MPAYTNEFDSARCDSYEDFLKVYRGDLNATEIIPNINLLSRAILGDQGEAEGSLLVQG
jgi:hypothetical protein